METRRAMVMFSGGLDSTVSLYDAIQRYSEVVALTFIYGSSHEERELMAAKEICRRLDIEHIIIDLPFMKQHLKSGLLGDNSQSFIVPFRNGIMVSIAAGIADSRGIDDLILTTHYTDSSCFPDCTQTFDEYMRRAVLVGTEHKVRLIVPFSSDKKSKIVIRGHELNIPFDLTYSCYTGETNHCGRCPTCIERARAFKEANIDDTTRYEVKPNV